MVCCAVVGPLLHLHSTLPCIEQGVLAPHALSLLARECPEYEGFSVRRSFDGPLLDHFLHCLQFVTGNQHPSLVGGVGLAFALHKSGRPALPSQSKIILQTQHHQQRGTAVRHCSLRTSTHDKGQLH